MKHTLLRGLKDNYTCEGSTYCACLRVRKCVPDRVCILARSDGK